MHRNFAAAALAATAALWPAASRAQAEALTLEQALKLARERAPTTLLARERVEEVRGRLAGAAVLLRENPQLDAALGPRAVDGRSALDAEVGLSQTFELGGQRATRMAGAQAAVARAQAAGEDATRLLLRDVAVGFFRTLHAQEQLRLARANEEVAAQVLRVTERRLEAGDVPRLEVGLSAAALSRARSEVRTAEAAQAASLGQLRALLGLGPEEPLALQGPLQAPRRLVLAELLSRAEGRADFRALEAEQAEAAAELRLGTAQAWPDLGVGVRYQREEEANVVLGTLALSLPVFERGQGLKAEASARARRLGLELELGRRLAREELRAAFEAYERHLQAAEELERTALPLLDDNETLSRRAYEAGQLGLADLLVVRREVAGMRLAYLDRLLEAAVAGVQLEALAGVLP